MVRWVCLPFLTLSAAAFNKQDFQRVKEHSLFEQRVLLWLSYNRPRRRKSAAGVKPQLHRAEETLAGAEAQPPPVAVADGSTATNLERLSDLVDDVRGAFAHFR